MWRTERILYVRAWKLSYRFKSSNILLLVSFQLAFISQWILHQWISALGHRSLLCSKLKVSFQCAFINRSTHSQKRLLLSFIHIFFLFRFMSCSVSHWTLSAIFNLRRWCAVHAVQQNTGHGYVFRLSPRWLEISLYQKTRKKSKINKTAEWIDTLLARIKICGAQSDDDVDINFYQCCKKRRKGLLHGNEQRIWKNERGKQTSRKTDKLTEYTMPMYIQVRRQSRYRILITFWWAKILTKYMK